MGPKGSNNAFRSLSPFLGSAFFRINPLLRQALMERWSLADQPTSYQVQQKEGSSFLIIPEKEMGRALFG